MNILAVGDSFTYGDELADRNDAWPSVLAKKLNCAVDNFGQPAASNDYIVRTTLDKALRYDLIIIAWTHFARIEFADERGIYDIWPGCQSKNFAHLDLTYRQQLIEYITAHHNDMHQYTKYMNNIILLQAYLNYHNKKYLMMDAFANNAHRQLTKLYKIEEMQFIGYPSESMMEWTWGCPKGPNGHFLEQGHKIVANKIYEHIRYLGWFS